jgi:precorrin-6A synthase
MIDVVLIGIGTGNPEHLTLEAVSALRSADAILIPRKGEEKAQLADVRRVLFDRYVNRDRTRLVEFDMPVRRRVGPDYRGDVDNWHIAIAEKWKQALVEALGPTLTTGTVAFLIWGDPSLYDSSLRIAERLSADMQIRVRVVPGLTSIQLLTASHNLPLNEIGESVLITTGRKLISEGWPQGADTIVVMLDGDNAFTKIAPENVYIWWGAYLGLLQEMTRTGPLTEISNQIAEDRAAARAKHGWIMDIYILRRCVKP